MAWVVVSINWNVLSWYHNCTETKRSSGWLPWLSLASFNVPSDEQGNHPDGLSISVWRYLRLPFEVKTLWLPHHDWRHWWLSITSSDNMTVTVTTCHSSAGNPIIFGQSENIGFTFCMLDETQWAVDTNFYHHPSVCIINGMRIH